MPRRNTLIVAPSASHGMMHGTPKVGLTLEEQLVKINKKAVAIRAEREKAIKDAEEERLRVAREAAERRIRINRR